MHHLLLFFCLFLGVIRVFGQNGEVLPVQFGQYYQNYSLVHPAATGLNKSFQIFLGQKAQTGIFQGVNTSYVGINFRLKTKDSLQKDGHGLGINFINNREGPYFNRQRFYLSYAWHNHISWNWILSGGITLGAINYIYKGSNINAGGSAIKPTADVGVLLYSLNKTHIGLTIGQVIPGDMSPLESQLIIKRHFNFSIDKTFKLSPYFSLMPAFIIRTPVRKNSIDADASLLVIMQEVFTCGAHYKIHQGYSFIGGVNDIKLGSAGFNLFISYYAPFANRGNINLIEASCIFTRQRLFQEESLIEETVRMNKKKSFY